MKPSELCARCHLTPRLPYHAYCRPCKLAGQRRSESAVVRKAQGQARGQRWMKEKQNEHVI